MDKVGASKRSEIMRRVRSTDTRPELTVRRLIHAMGYRFRLHRRDLPGVPDIVLPRLRAVAFIHGCFWHGHACRAGRNRPASNVAYWERKLNRNRERDVRAQIALRRLGWRVLTIWECELRDRAKLENRLRRFLSRD